jgi:CBS domain-containing protein
VFGTFAASVSLPEEAHMRIAEIMTQDVYCCSSGDSLAGAARIMWEHDCGSVPIIDEQGTPIAMLTDRDIAMAIYLNGRLPSQISVYSAMSKQLFCCSPDDSIETAEAIMRDRQVRRLPVVDGGKLVGFLSMNDLIRAASEKKLRRDVRVEDVEATMAAICQPRVPVPAPTGA